MNLLTRPIVAVVCLLFVLLAMPALGQKFMPQEIVEADAIDEEKRERIMMVVDPAMFDLTREEVDVQDLIDARKQITSLFRVNQPSAAYLDALSAAIADRLPDAVNHESALVRINAMIVLRDMVDDGSKPLIDKGLADKSDAVKHWAMEALGKRMQYWKARDAAGVRGMSVKIDDAIKQIVGIVDVAEPPHTIVVASALESLVKVNTSASRQALIDLLNKRVALHKADPELTYDPERQAIDAFIGILVGENPPDVTSIKGICRAMGRYAILTVGQLQGGQIPEDLEKSGKSMLFQCMNGMANACATAGAPKPSPADHNQARNWVMNDRWDELSKLANEEWPKILTAPPIGLNATGLQP